MELSLFLLSIAVERNLGCHLRFTCVEKLLVTTPKYLSKEDSAERRSHGYTGAFDPQINAHPPPFYYRGIENRFEKKEGIKDAQPPSGLWLIFSKDPRALLQKKGAKNKPLKRRTCHFIYLSVCLYTSILFMRMKKNVNDPWQ